VGGQQEWADVDHEQYWAGTDREQYGLGEKGLGMEVLVVEKRRKPETSSLTFSFTLVRYLRESCQSSLSAR